MGRFDLSDEDIERLLSGRAPGELEDLSKALTDFRSAFVAPVEESTVQQHLSAIAGEVALAGPGGLAPVESAAQGLTGRRTRMKTLLGAIGASFWTKLAGVALAAATLTGGLGATGNLGPAQDTFDNVAEVVGIDNNGKAKGHDKDKTADVDDDATEGTDDLEALDPTESPSPNHGACVSYAASVASKDLTGADRGQFVSMIAKDEEAISAKVAEDGTPDAACQAAITEAKAAALADNETTEKVPGPPSGETGNANGQGKGVSDEQAGGTDTDGGDDETKEKSEKNPGYGPDSHPGGDPR
ncbi:MAG: hypothetical protein ACRDIU_00645 [Actinomycetota bacterium]